MFASDKRGSEPGEIASLAALALHASKPRDQAGLPASSAHENYRMMSLVNQGCNLMRSASKAKNVSQIYTISNENRMQAATTWSRAK